MRAPATPLLALVAVLVLGPVLVDCGVQEDEFVCEDTAAHLASCCPSLDPRLIVCPVSGAFCEPPPSTFSLTQNRCLRELDCDAIRRGGVCERIAAVTTGDAGVVRGVCE